MSVAPRCASVHDFFQHHRYGVPGHSPHDYSVQVIVGDESHVYQYEAGGMSCLGGVAFHVIPTDLNGELPLEALSAAIRQGPSLCNLQRNNCYRCYLLCRSNIIANFCSRRLPAGLGAACCPRVRGVLCA